MFGFHKTTKRSWSLISGAGMATAMVLAATNANALDIGVSVGGSSGVSAGASVGSSGASAGASVGGSSGASAGASVGGSSGVNARATIGEKKGVKATVGTGKKTLFGGTEADISINLATPQLRQSILVEEPPATLNSKNIPLLFKNMSSGEMQQLLKDCRSVLNSPRRYPAMTVRLCRLAIQL